MASSDSTQQVTCPACNVRLKLKSRPKAGKKMRCPKCRHVFTVGASGPNSQPTKARPTKAPSAKALGRRKKNDRQAPPASAEITAKWVNLIDGAGPVILIVLLSMVAIVMMSTAVKDDRTGVRIFCLLFSIPAALIVYRIVISRFNRTVLRLEGGQLNFKCEPYPWINGRPISMAGVSDVATVKKFVSENRYKGKTRKIHHYSVVATYTDGRHQTIYKCSANQNLADRIQKFLAGSLSGIQAAGLQTDINVLDPGASSRILDNLNDDTVSVSTSTTPASAEWEVTSQGETWITTRRWYAPVTAAILLVIGIGFVVGVPLAIVNSTEPFPNAPWIWVALAVGAAALLGCLYSGAALLINRTEVVWDRTSLSLRHIPLPAWHAKPVASDRIVGFAVERKRRSSSNSMRETTDVSWSNRRHNNIRSTRMYLYDYLLLVKLDDGTSVRFYKTYRIEPVAELRNLLTRQLQIANG